MTTMRYEDHDEQLTSKKPIVTLGDGSGDCVRPRALEAAYMRLHRELVWKLRGMVAVLASYLAIVLVALQ